MRKFSLLLTLIMALLLVGCNGDDAADTAVDTADTADAAETAETEAVTYTAGDLVVSDVWGRNAPAVAANSAFYLTIANGGDEDESLLAAATDVCETVELHEMYMMENDAMGMREVPGGVINIPAGETVELRPGGLHVMCIGKTEAYNTNPKIPMTLTFANAGEMEVIAEIPTDAVESDSSGMGMGMGNGGQHGGGQGMGGGQHGGQGMGQGMGGGQHSGQGMGQGMGGGQHGGGQGMGMSDGGSCMHADGEGGCMHAEGESSMHMGMSGSDGCTCNCNCNCAADDAPAETDASGTDAETTEEEAEE